MITHVVYHIYGYKVGCTRDFNRRCTEYRQQKKFTLFEIEILEELHNKTDQEAGDIEWQWADKFGYSRGQHYTRTWSQFSNEELLDICRKGGKSRAERLSKDRLSEIARKAATAASPERRSEISRNAGLASFNNSTQEHRSRNARLGGLRTSERKNGSQYQRGECPHCGVQTTLAVLARVHNDRCKLKK
jgi:general stress protein YciG